MLTLVLLLTITAGAYACPKNCYTYQDTCACDEPVESGTPIKPSDEKPPKDKMPSYEREGIKVLDEPSMASDDKKQDIEKAEATDEGRKAIGK